MRMRAKFPLFQSHLDLAHSYWRTIVIPGDCVIDATCGNGKDIEVLCSFALGSPTGIVYGFDRQKEAIDHTFQLLTPVTLGLPGKWKLEQRCHSTFPQDIQQNSVKLIVYNLGYLPGGCKSETTEVSTTIKSIKAAEDLIIPNGVISITCYPGHEEGKREEDAILDLLGGLPVDKWSVCFHRWLNRRNAPSLILLQKAS